MAVVAILETHSMGLPLAWDPGSVPEGAAWYTNTDLVGSDYFFRIQPQAIGTGVWRTILDVQSGEANLYLAPWLPTTDNFTYASTNVGPDEVVVSGSEFTPGSEWYVLVHALPGSQWRLMTGQAYVQLLEWDDGSTPGGTAVFSNPPFRFLNYYFKIATKDSQAGAWRTALNVTGKEADLFIRQDSLPSTSDYTFSSTRIGSDGVVAYPSQFGGGQDWYLLVHAQADATWSLVSGDVYVYPLGSLASDGSSGTNINCGAEGTAFFKTTVPPQTPAWELWLNGATNELRLRRSSVPDPMSSLSGEPLPQLGQMLVVPDFLAAGTFNGSYFVSVAAAPGETIALDSRQQPVADIDFASTNGPALVTGFGYRTYRVVVPVKQIAWDLSVIPGVGDPNLAVRRDKVPNEWNNDAFSEAAGLVTDSITLVPPALSDGTFYLTVYGSGPYSFTLKSGPPEVPIVDFLGSDTNADTNRVGWRYYRVMDIPSQLGKLGWELLLSGAPPGTEIALRRNAVPGQWDYRSNNQTGISTASYLDFSNSDADLQRPAHQADIWYIGVYSPNLPLTDFTLLRRLLIPQSLTFDPGVQAFAAIPPAHWEFFRMSVPADAMGWDLRLANVTSGNPRLAVRRDELPQDLNSDWPQWPYAPWQSTNWPSGDAWAAGMDWTTCPYGFAGGDEQGRILAMGLGNPLEPGEDYYIGVVNAEYPTTRDVSPMSYTILSRGIGPGYSIPVQPLAFAGGSVTNLALGLREAAYYEVEVPSNTPSWKLQLHATSGETMMVVQKDRLPNVGAGYGFGKDALSLSGGNPMDKLGDEQYVLLPKEGADFVEAGKYYVAVVGEGLNASPDPDRHLGLVGDGPSAYTLTSQATLPVAQLGAVTLAGLLAPGSLAGGEVAAYQFTVPENTANIEVRLLGTTGHPTLAVRPGSALPMPWDSGGQGYGFDGGYLSDREFDEQLLTLANPSNGVYSVVVQAAHPYDTAIYALSVKIVPPQTLAFNGGSIPVTNQAADTWRFFQINMTSEATQQPIGWDLRLVNVTGGTPRLVVRRDQLPSGSATLWPQWPYVPWHDTIWPSGAAWAAGMDWTTCPYGADGSDEEGRILAMGQGNPLEVGSPSARPSYFVGVINADLPSTNSGPMSYTIQSRGIGQGFLIPVESLDFAGGSVTNTALDVREAAYYHVLVPTNVSSWKVQLTVTSGEAMLVVQKDRLPNVGAGASYGNDALSLSGGNPMDKIGDEQYLLLPKDGAPYVESGDYYLAVVGQGANASPDTTSHNGKVGTGPSAYVLTSVGVATVAQLGEVTAAGLSVSGSLAGGEVGVYQFTVAANTSSVEVRLSSKTGNPTMALRPGAGFPSPWDSTGLGYGADGGYYSNRQFDPDLVTLANPAMGVYSVVVQASHPYEAARYTLSVTSAAPQSLGFDGGLISVANQAPGTWRFFEVTMPFDVSHQPMGWDVRLSNVTGGTPRMIVRRDQLPNGSATVWPQWPYIPWQDTDWPSGNTWAAGMDWTTCPYGADGSDEEGRILAMGRGNPLVVASVISRVTYYVGVINSDYPSTNSGPMSYDLTSRGIGPDYTLPVQPLAFDAGSVTNFGLGAREAAYYVVRIPTNTPSWKVQLQVIGSDAMLVVQKDRLPNVGAGAGYVNDALSLTGGNQMDKAGDEQYVLLPKEGAQYVEPGDYYLTVVGEGVGAQPDQVRHLGSIGFGACDYILTSQGSLPINQLGQVTSAELTSPGTLAGGEVAAYEFTTAGNTPAVEVRLEDVVGNPTLAAEPGAALAVPWDPDSRWSYGVDGGYTTGRLADSSIVTIANPGNQPYGVVVQAAFPYAPAAYTMRVRQMPVLDLNFESGQDVNGRTNVVSVLLADNQRAFFRVEVPAVDAERMPVIGWQLDLTTRQGQPSVRVRKDLLPQDGSDYATSPWNSPSAYIVPPYLTPGTWYVEVRGAGATDLTLTSNPLRALRTWTLPTPDQPRATPGLTPPEFGETGTDDTGAPILSPEGDRGTDLQQGHFDYYALVVPNNNAGLLRTILEAISGNPTLYLRVGDPPALSHQLPVWPYTALYDRSQTAKTTQYGNWVPLEGRQETQLAPGIWYLAVQAAGNSNVRYRLHLSTGSVQDLPINGPGYSSQTLAGGDWSYYRVQVPPDAPANWQITFSQQSGDVVLYLRDTLPPGFGVTPDLWNIQDWSTDQKNHGPYPSFDAPGTYTLAVPPVRPGSVYYLGFRAVNDAVFSVSSTATGTFDYMARLPFYGGYISNMIPAFGVLKFRVDVPIEGVRWIDFATHSSDISVYLDQGSVPTFTEADTWRSVNQINSSLDQVLNGPAPWPWLAGCTYFLAATNTSSSPQPFSFGLYGLGPRTPPPSLTSIAWLPAGPLQITAQVSPGLKYGLQVSLDLVNWANLGDFMPTSPVWTLSDSASSIYPMRFYRLVQR